MVSEHSGRGVSISLIIFFIRSDITIHIIDISVFLCCCSLDLFLFITLTDRSIVFVITIDRSERFDQVFIKNFSTSHRSCFEFQNSEKFYCVCESRSVVRSNRSLSVHLVSSSVESDL